MSDEHEPTHELAQPVNSDLSEPKAMALPEPAMPEPSNTDKKIDAWWQDKMQGSIVARNVEIWNYMREAMEDLKKRLGG